MLTSAQRSDVAPSVPFDSGRLDRLMEEARIDVVLATSKHNVQYLLGGHRSLFFTYMDAMGPSRYLPVAVYPKGAADKAAYIGHRIESHQHQVEPFWTPEVQTSSAGSVDAMQKAIDHLRRAGLKPRRIGVELAFLPADAAAALTTAFPDSEIVDAVFPLERLRAIKTAQELENLRLASECVIESMLAVIASHGAGATKSDLVEAMRREETNRGLIFDYCLLAMGTSFNRAASDQTWQPGDVLSIDSGGNLDGYIGDLARMAILGEPDSELEGLLAEVEEIQQAAMKPIRPGAMGGDIYVAALEILNKSSNGDHIDFVAHGIGLVTHESPRLTNRGRQPYASEDARRPLEAGMVVSVETTLQHPRRGYIKLEDTLAVTNSGFEVFGNRARGWNRGGTSV